MRRIFLCLPFILLSTTAFAAEPLGLVITPTRSETPIDQVGSSVTVITADDIERKQQHSVVDLLREVPGVDIVRNGGQGQTTYAFIRGASSEHTLVLIDGVPVNDPSSTAGAYDLGQLSTDNIERIEILRGNESTLYGSQAIGGVINIISKKGKGTPTVNASVEGGSYSTYKAAGGSSGQVGPIGYSVAASQFHTRGFSVFNERRGGTERDGDDSSTFATRLSGKINEQANIYGTLRYSDTRVGYDDVGLDAFGRYNNSRELTGRAAAQYKAFDGIWDQELGVSHYRLARDSTSGIDGDYRGTRDKLDWLNHLRAGDHNLITFGLETQRERAYSTYSTVQTVGTDSGFIQDQFTWENFSTAVGMRRDDHETFGGQNTYRIAPSYKITQTGTRLKGSYGTGFKAPSLFQLYSSFGDPTLSPEKSKGYDLGFEQSVLNDRVQFGSTFFHTELESLIDFDLVASRYNNIGAATIKGFESFIAWQPTIDLSVKLQHTYTEASNDVNDLGLLRRAKHKAALDVDYSFWDKGRAGITALYNGHRQDVDLAFARTSMPGYLLVNLNSSWQVSNNIQLFGRVDNLLDKNYENAYGYGTAGLSAFAGVRAQY